MIVRKCANCRHWRGGHCLDEEVRGRRWSDGSLCAPPTRMSEDGCLWRFSARDGNDRRMANEA